MGLGLRCGNYMGFIAGLILFLNRRVGLGLHSNFRYSSLLRSFPTSLLLQNWGLSLLPLIAQGPFL